MSQHPGELVLERFSVDDLGAAERDQVAEHLCGCGACRSRVEEIRGLQTARLEAVPADRFVGQVAARRDQDAEISRARRRRWLSGSAAGALAAAAALIVVLRPQPGGPLPGDRDTRLKGTGFTLLDQRAAEARALASDERVRAGDRLQLVATQVQAGPVAAWTLDGEGHLEPVVAGGAVRLEAGRQPLPATVTVEPPCADFLLVAAAGAAIQATDAWLKVRIASPRLPLDQAWLAAAAPPPAEAWVRLVRCE